MKLTMKSKYSTSTGNAPINWFRRVKGQTQNPNYIDAR
jgi:hypothetical protein